MWGAASFLFRCARCSCMPVWVRGSRSSRRCPYRVAVPPEGGGRPPGPGGAEGRACGSPAEVGAGGWVGLDSPDLKNATDPSIEKFASPGSGAMWVRGGGGAAPPPALGPVWEGGGGVGGALWSPGDASCRPGGGGGHGSPGPGGQPSAGGSRPSPAPLYRGPDSRAGPRWGPSSPGHCRAAPAGRGWP